MMRTHLRLQVLATVLIMFGVSACDMGHSPSKTSRSTGAPTKSAEKEVKPEMNQLSDETKQKTKGKATWYGPGLYGNKTASGDLLKEGTLTAAHSSLPLGTEVKVTRLDTNESVKVVINDRKPYKEGTVIDLAHGAADALDIDDDGSASVSIEVIK